MGFNHGWQEAPSSVKKSFLKPGMYPSSVNVLRRTSNNKLMKIRIKHHFLLPILIAGLSLGPCERVMARPFAVLYTFTDSSNGGEPSGNFILSSNILIGPELNGSPEGQGFLFTVDTNGQDFNRV
jgi:hypothetical protein